jgi:S-disulfanyl-L-cysteine oxidoreductase SoxD
MSASKSRRSHFLVSVLRIDHTALRGFRWSEVAREHAAPAQGAVVYAQKCAVCHGDKGEGKINARLVGGQITGDGPVVKTVGSYWPYATTLFDFVRRAMPWNQPKSLTNDEVYAVSAYVLRMNNIIGENDVMDAKTLPQVKMPNRDGFIPLFPNKH